MNRVIPNIALLLAFGVAGASAQITDLSQWTLLNDPAHPFLSGSATTGTATLTAGDGAIPFATDIGFSSVNGSTAADSTAGFAFSPDADFHISIDFALSFVSTPAADGVLSLGFGIGEDTDGMNSAGIGMVTSDGSPLFFFAGAARTNNVDQPIQGTAVPAALDGTMSIQYFAANGDIAVGAQINNEFGNASASKIYERIQRDWSGDDLLASFFIRSDQNTFLNLAPWSGGQADAVFSNFHVLQGQAIAVPEPASATLLGVVSLGLLRRRRA